MKKKINLLIVFTLLLSIFTVPTYAKSNDIEIKIDVLSDGRIVYNYDINVEELVEHLEDDIDVDDFMDELEDHFKEDKKKIDKGLEEGNKYSAFSTVDSIKVSGDHLLLQKTLNVGKDDEVFSGDFNMPLESIDSIFDDAENIENIIEETLGVKKSELKGMNILFMSLDSTFGSIQYSLYNIVGYVPEGMDINILISFQGKVMYSVPELSKQSSNLMTTYYSIKESDEIMFIVAYKPQELPTIMYAAIGAGILLVLIIVILLIRRSKKRKKQTFGEPYVEVIEGEYKGAKIPLNEEGIFIGRDPDICSLIYSPGTKGISRKHCRIEFDRNRNQFVITDYSTIGTYLKNNTKLKTSEPTYVSNDTEIYLGSKDNQLRCYFN